MYVGVEEGGIFRSRNDGATFESLNDGLYEDIHTVAVDSRDSRRLYATTGAGFFMSNNAGNSWEQVTRGLNRTYTIPLLVSAPDSDDLFTAAAMGPPPTGGSGRPARTRCCFAAPIAAKVSRRFPPNRISDVGW